MKQPTVPKRGESPSLGNVLVATDFSSSAARAVARAARLPITPGSVISILHVLPGKTDARGEAAAQRSLVEQRRIAERAAREAGLEDVNVLTHVAHGTPFVEIVSYARHMPAHLVVVGRHGKRTFRDLLLGSTAERVIRMGTTPVLVVGSRATSPYRRPLIAVDGSDASRRAFELALRVASRARDVDVVHAYGVPYESATRPAKISEKDLREYGFETATSARALIGTFLSNYQTGGWVFDTTLRRGDPRQVILRTAAQHHADLLALGTHGRSGLTHALIGSVAEAVVRAALCDVLVSAEK